MSDIRDSDTIPTPQDQANALEMFAGQDGALDAAKMANTIARLHRKESHQQLTLEKLGTSVDSLSNDFKTHRIESRDQIKGTQADVEDMKIALMGDNLGTFKGMIKEHKEQGNKINCLDIKMDVVIDKLGATDEAQEATTKKIKKETDPFIERFKGVVFFGAWFITTLLALLAILV